MTRATMTRADRLRRRPSPVRRAVPPAGPSRGVVVVIHGGFWQAKYDASLGEPLAAPGGPRAGPRGTSSTAASATAAASRRPSTTYAAAIEALADVDVDTSTVVTLGHSAGGHLAAWAAARGRFERWPDAGAGDRRRLPGRSPRPRAGLRPRTSAAARSRRSSGSRPRPATTTVDPIRQVPLDVPVVVRARPRRRHRADRPVRGRTSTPRPRPAPRPSWSRSTAATSWSSSSGPAWTDIVAVLDTIA